MKLAFLAAAWLVGVFVGLETNTPLVSLLLLLGAAVSVGAALWLKGLPVFTAVLAVVLVLVMSRADSVSGPLPPLTSQEQKSVTLEGRISTDPEFAGRGVEFVLDVSGADLGSGTGVVENRVLVYAEPPDSLVDRRPPPYFDYGDLVTVVGTLRNPEPFGGFDYPAFLANQGITDVMSANSATVTGESGGWRAWPYSLRSRLANSIDATLGYPQSALGKALLLGRRGDPPPDMVQDFRSTGTSHLLAISGLHVGVLVVMFLAGAAWLFGRRNLFYLAVPLVVVWAYALVSGLPPSVVRAAVMGSVYLAAVGFGRPGSILPALALSAGVMTAISPEIIQRVSFQLSFAAVAGIALAQSFIPHWSFPDAAQKGSWWRPPAFSLLRASSIALIISLAAMLATWPLVAFNFGEVAVLGPVITILALPVMPFILGGTLLMAFVGLFSSGAGQLIGWLVWVPSSYLIELVKVAPGWTFQTDWAGTWLVWAWYSALGGLLLLLTPYRVGALWTWLKDRTHAPGHQQSLDPAKVLPIVIGALMMTAAATVLWWQVGQSGDGNLHVYFFDVGQGDSALIVTPEGRQVLVDGGPKTDSAIRALGETISGNDRSLDLVVLTHLDADHSRGLLQVLDRYEVGAVLTGADTPSSAMHAQWQAEVEHSGVEVVSVSQGYRLDLGSDVSIEILNPRPVTSDRTQGNNDSLVLRMTYGSVSFLLAADIESETEAVLEHGETRIQSTVLKVAHHGSKTSSTSEFVSEVSPDAALISVGANNSFGHPNPEVLSRLQEKTGAENLYRTDLNGDVEFVTDGSELWVFTDR